MNEVGIKVSVTLRNLLSGYKIYLIIQFSLNDFINIEDNKNRSGK